MNIADEHIDDLIGLVLTNEASDSQRAELLAWIGVDADRQRYFDQMKRLYSSANNTDSLLFDTDAAWQKVHGVINSKGKIVSLPRRDKSRSWKYMAAASVVIALIVFTWMFYQPTKHEIAIHSGSTVLTDTLPDGSTAILNKESHLTYAFDRKTNSRKAKLSGEAYFSVVHDDKQTFIIEANNTFIRDIGTRFNVVAPQGGDSVIVAVTEGEVAFYSAKDDGLILTAGEQGVYLLKQQKFYKRTISDNDGIENVAPYSDRQFRYRNAAIHRVIQQINDVYGSNIKLETPDMGDCRITVTFGDDDLETIIDVIAETMEWNVSRNNENIMFMGSGCGVREN